MKIIFKKHAVNIIFDDNDCNYYLKHQLSSLWYDQLFLLIILNFIQQKYPSISKINLHEKHLNQWLDQNAIKHQIKAHTRFKNNYMS